MPRTGAVPPKAEVSTGREEARTGPIIADGFPFRLSPGWELKAW